MQTRIEICRKNPKVLIKQLLCSHYVTVKPFHCDKGSRAFHLFVHLSTYVYILLPESFHVHSA